ncbi:aryl-alcohol dehydrogenase-like predicted oxidoreductase [Natranaerovirga hydrolytica]|uniref:Aryl-alcohol dehydrogenase-like predicted oxidoreductase n=1 Tax=Natranaerovirga hydrolytica TaxID=680378 RepID=A0A4R1MK34_9FIRM|nr:aldo/keto reductase [Natranaerovirga hydrolytica]TCK92897.1 aryl-alcohol dehydrogenase-like predicted oxidoreductase [Natranaerovirga hydrolytica]
MNYRTLGKTGYKISEVSYGSWAIGGTWGDVDDKTSLLALETAIDQGINFFDTADVYGDGRSEKLLSKLSKSVKDKIYIATKAGRRLNPHNTEGYNKANLEAFIDRSLKNLDMDCIDLLQLHCPPTEVFYNEEVFSALDDFKKAGKIAHYGVSVEKVSEAIKSLDYDNVASIQIIYNMFRHKPHDELFQLTKEKNVGMICRVPLASGLLTGKMSSNTAFAKDDHRFFNRNGESFDKGETFSGVDYKLGLQAVEALKQIKPHNMTMAQFALKWILMNQDISCVIPGGKTKEQVQDNASSSDLPTLSKEIMSEVVSIYDQYIRESVHPLW